MCSLFFIQKSMYKAKLIEYLSNFTTTERFNIFNEVLNKRTNYITVLLEDIYQSQNASAVLRTADCFGIQNIHITENKNQYNINPDVVLGASKWLTLNKYNKNENNTLETINTLKALGYRIIATTPHSDDVNLEDFDISKGKFALMFGSEKPGLSKIALDNADEFLKIPMHGFTESFNISVSAAISLHYLSLKLRNSEINWKITSEEKNNILLNWLKNSIKKADEIEQEFIKRQNN